MQQQEDEAEVDRCFYLPYFVQQEDRNIHVELDLGHRLW